MKRLRLVSVVVQPVIVEDDLKTGSLKPIDHDPVVVPAEEWPTYSSDRFPREMKEWEDRINSPDPNSKSPNVRVRRSQQRTRKPTQRKRK